VSQSNLKPLKSWAASPDTAIGQMQQNALAMQAIRSYANASSWNGAQTSYATQQGMLEAMQNLTIPYTPLPKRDTATSQAGTNGFKDPIKCIGGPLDGQVVEGWGMAELRRERGKFIAPVRYLRARMAKGGQSDGYDVFIAEGVTIEGAIERLLKSYGRVGVAAPCSTPAGPDFSAERKAMASHIEVLSERLTQFDKDRRRLVDRLDVRDSMLAAANAEIEHLHAQVAALSAKLPPEPPAPPTAGETVAHCMRAIFPQER